MSTQDYINAVQFQQAIIKFKHDWDMIIDKHPDKDLSKQDKDKLRPQTREYQYIGKCIIDIIEGVLKKGNFKDYSEDWKNDFALEAQHDMIRALRSFKVTEDDNDRHAFNYFSTICHNAFIRIITRNKRRAGQQQEYRDMVQTTENINDVYACHKVKVFNSMFNK